MSTTRFIPFEEGALESEGITPGWNWDESRQLLEDPRFGQVLHVILERDGKPQNDQILRVEQGPGCFVPLSAGGKIGLVQHEFRPQVRDKDAHLRLWPYNNIASLTELVGRSSWEIPRGYAKTDESGETTAKREAEEETGSTVTAQVELGYVCGNTAIEPHFMAVVAGLVDQNRVGQPGDPNERLLSGLTFFDRDGIDTLIGNGELYCGVTLSALRLLDAQGIDNVLCVLK